MQARAIFEGALAGRPKETGSAPVPEIMIPLVGTRRELEITRAQIDEGGAPRCSSERAARSNTVSAR